MDQLFDQLWHYNNWANRSLFDLFEQYGAKVPVNCLHLLSHIVNTQSVWVGRIIGEPSALTPWTDHSLEECKIIHQESAELVRQLLEKHQNGEMNITYVNTKGAGFNNTLNDILIHVFNHGTYHRAQIAQELRRAGLEPINTDYINFVR